MYEDKTHRILPRILSTFRLGGQPVTRHTPALTMQYHQNGPVEPMQLCVYSPTVIIRPRLLNESLSNGTIKGVQNGAEVTVNAHINARPLALA